ncbi:CABP1 [Symbiodinium sp. CCMP2592]|nr:CABP1 [Symbiodinium sp. CCMP2592]
MTFRYHLSSFSRSRAAGPQSELRAKGEKVLGQPNPQKFTVMGAEDGSSDASSSFGDEPPESSPIVHAPSMQSIQMRRKSIEAMLARRRNSNRKTSAPNVMPEEAGPAKEAGPAAKIMLKHVRARGEVFAGSEADLQDPDLIEILTPPDEQEVLMRMGDSSEGFTEKDAERLRKAFVLHRQAFRVLAAVATFTGCGILDYLGYLKISEADIHAMVAEITRYSTMEFEEFMSFMTRARAFDQNQVREKFALFDADQSGELSADELEDVLKSLGITPSRTTIAGALAVVDEDGSGSLDFEEFVQLLLIYRKTEGFAESEVLKLHRIFTRFAETKPSASGRRMLPYDRSNKALIEMFGSQAAQLASRLGSAMPRPPSEGEEGKKPTKKAEGMTFREFLIWARRLREIEVQWYQQEFARADVDKGGFLDEEEIRLVLQRLGYTPLRAVIFDMIEAVDPQKRVDLSASCFTACGMLDFDEFVQMMELFRNSNGFMRHEVREFKQSFDMFDTEKVGEVDVIQVGGILRSLGFATELAEVQVLLKTVDWNGSNSLDFSEFLRLMRMHREQELLRIRDTFDKYADTDVLDDGVVKVTVEPGDVKTMLRLLGFSDNFVTSTTGVFRALLREALDYDAMVLLCDSCRRMNMEKMRKQAGFSDEAVEKFQKLFRALDSVIKGELSQSSMALKQEIVQSVNKRMDTVEEKVGNQLQRTLEKLAALTESQADQGRTLATVQADQREQGSRLTQLEQKVHQLQLHGGSSTADTEGGLKQPALIMGRWEDDSPAAETLEKAKGMISQLRIDIDTDAQRDRGELRERLQQAIKRVRTANIAMGRRDDGGNRYLWLQMSQSPERRRRAHLAGKVKRLILSANGGSTHGLEVEWPTGTVWWKATRVCSATTSPVARAEMAGAGWVDLRAIAHGEEPTGSTEDSEGEDEPSPTPLSTYRPLKRVHCFHLATWNVGDLTADCTLDLLRTFGGAKHLCMLHVALLQEVITDWAAFREHQRQTSKKGDWVAQLLDTHNWQGALLAHFSSIFHKADGEAKTAAFNEMAWGKHKSTGVDGIAHETLQMLILHPIWGERVLAMLNEALYTGKLPAMVERGLTILLPKGGSPAGWEDTRPITLSSAVLKTLSQLLLLRGNPCLRPLYTYQWASPQRQGVELILVLRKIARMGADWGGDFWIIKLDLQKAFDSVAQDSLGGSVTQHVGPSMPWARLWLSWLDARHIHIAVGGAEVEVDQTNGVRQGPTHQCSFRPAAPSMPGLCPPPSSLQTVGVVVVVVVVVLRRAGVLHSC